MRFLVFPLILLTMTFPGYVFAAGKKVHVKISFLYDSFPGKMEAFDVRPASKFDISETRNVADMKQVPATEKLASSFDMNPGQSKTFVLVIKNDTDQDWFFNASPHSIMPMESSMGQKFECLCNHMIYKVQKKSIWYRIVRFELEKDFNGSSVDLTHHIIGVDSKAANGKYREMLYH